MKVIQMNEEENARIAKRRRDRLLSEAEERRFNLDQQSCQTRLICDIQVENQR